MSYKSLIHPCSMYACFVKFNLVLKVLDHAEPKDHLTQEELAKFLTEEGEPFSSEEIEELMAAALDSQKGTVNYRECVHATAS